MQFINALWYAGSALGFLSIVAFFALMLSVFNEEHIEREIGYRYYFIIMGSYALIAWPLAATINGGTGPDFLFLLGCLCPALITLSNKLEARYKAERAQRIAAQPQLRTVSALPPRLDPVPQTMREEQDQRRFTPAPSSLASDFDVPPQR